MAEITVALDAGHGGSDSGAVYGNRREKDDVLRLSKAVGKILENNGINVFYVRNDDEYEIPFKKATDANNAGADYFVSLHRNSSERPNQYSGVETLVYDDTGVKAVMARNINSQLEKAGYKNLGVDERPNLVVLKRTKMPAVLVEVGFINNDNDNKIFDENFNLVAQAIADGILDTVYSNEYASNSVNQPAQAQTMSQSAEDYEASQYEISQYSASQYEADQYEASQYENGGYQPAKCNCASESKDILSRTDMSSVDMDSDKMMWDNMPQGNMMQDNMSQGNMMQDNMPQNNMMQEEKRQQNAMYGYNEYNDDETTEKLYRVQVGAYRNKDSADRMLNSLLVEGFPAFIVYDDGIYKVQVGAFRFLANAIKMEERLRKFRYNTYITV